MAGARRLAATTPIPTAVTTPHAQGGNSVESAISPAATANATPNTRLAQSLETWLGSRLDIQTTAAPKPMAAKKATPKYQYGRRRPFQSFHRWSPNMSGKMSGNTVGSG